MKGNCGECERRYFCEIDPDKCNEWPDPVPQTNADRIRAMSDEELMQLLFTKISCGHICSFCVPSMRTEDKCDGHCRNGVLKWLKQPAEAPKEEMQ